MAAFQLRPAQEKIMQYQGGKMGVIAVPGSGKTWTLSYLAAEIIASGVLRDDQEVLVVTLVNSAVQNFQQRVAGFLEEKRLLPYLGIRVRTLHGLAHDLVRERPGLVNLDENFQILDENEADRVRSQIAQSWLSSHPEFLEEYLSTELNEKSLYDVERKRLPKQLSDIANSFIRTVKDLRITPQFLEAQLEDLPLPLSLAQMGSEMYSDYQRALAYRGMVDFDDLINLALQALESNPAYLERWQQRWPFILEDEAQDSSRLQEKILSLLAGKDGNWVRVGDPNQAIFETFTTASPDFLRKFIYQEGVERRHLPNSGRSTVSIINLANQLVEWTINEHPVEEIRFALQAPPWIEPAPPGDPQPNPEDDPSQVYLHLKKFSARKEVEVIAESLQRWLPEHQEQTVAVLVSTNPRAQELLEEFEQRKIEFVDSLLKSTSATRLTAGVLSDILSALADPISQSKLANAYRAWRSLDLEAETQQKEIHQGAAWLQKLVRVEDFLYPSLGKDYFEQAGNQLDSKLGESMLEFRRLFQRWQSAVLLPVDQLLLTLAQDLFSEPVDLALTHKLAGLLRQAAFANPNWRIPEFNQELKEIASNKRRFLGFSDEDTGFNPDKYKGKVVVATMHKAKGLEWDRVYLMSVNNYDFPSDPLTDMFLPDKWYIRQKLNLEAETLAQLEALLSQDAFEWYEEGEGSQKARLDYIRERLRLLYVGITRARRELVITWNTGKNGDLQPALAFLELASRWESISRKDKR